MHFFDSPKSLSHRPVPQCALLLKQGRRQALWKSLIGGMIWENDIETCIISYMKRIASPGLMHDTGCLGLVHWDDPEGWYWEGGGRGVQDGAAVSLQSCLTLCDPIDGSPPGSPVPGILQARTLEWVSISFSNA